MSPKHAIQIYRDREQLASAATDLIVRSAQKHIADTGQFTCVMAGGTTPRRVYKLLAISINAVHIDWRHTYLFWGDERAVPPDHEDSNFRMVENSLLEHVPLPAENIFRMRGEIPPLDAALQYELVIKGFFKRAPQQSSADGLRRDIPVFDLVLLGIGTDGHTASLFPGSSALGENERLVVAVEHKQPPLPLVSRLTMTLPLINHAKEIVFLANGAGKTDVLQQILGDKPNLDMPAARVQPVKGRLFWLLDADAAADIRA